MPRLTIDLLARRDRAGEERDRREQSMRRGRRELRPCVEVCEPRLLLSGPGTSTMGIYLGDGSGGFNSQKS